MDLNLIKKLVKILETSEVTDIEIEENGTKIKVAKKVRIAPAMQTVTNVPSQTTAVSVQQKEETKPVEKKTTEETAESSLHTVRSPIVGTFYRAPAPDADPYVQVGDVVSVGTVLCIVEAMKLMNEIESDVNGKIVKILVENGKPVEYNQPLFLIQPM
ncbi:MAG: acetyl-CoA carboxylase biotin carboxyl carrier protein [Ignavibacterium sp.]|jgi:acetyl-CoA carboxylase biotin carboxyl carrier protein|uniref:Biotin carboxyl carrier protein of acetyl-CoA carboxylase n=1 Tax=Ignavibacterium album TaxID=591197 RepID=A0A7V2ZL42_9BACT|nr:acetyl-CoA carboxylase biotin carboxyl carrier protein [Ignavibacterium album]MCA2004825.1 acetyl-CoA carboxylase biotin carboxyl carrier protein [Ignavibacterium sp.]MCX8105179.1 acetyl-CoA carboxylase biotin carboxyl carrier protein [Ignavibacterium album]